MEGDLPAAIWPLSSPPTSRSPSLRVGSHKHHDVSSRSIPLHLPQRSLTSVAPVLSTAARAHRKVHSSAGIPPSPSLERRSPTWLRRKSSAHSRSTSSSSMAFSYPHGPVTPSQRGQSRPGSKLQDSPFSDYFTDNGRSPNGDSAPSPETQHLLIRLSRLQSQLMRGEREAEREVIAIVGTKIQEMEEQLNSVHVQTRPPLDMDDSALFMDEEDEDEIGEETSSKHDTPVSAVKGASPSLDDVFTSSEPAENRKQEHEQTMAEAQRVLENVRQLEENLRQRHAELREMNGRYNADADEVERRLEEHENENETLEHEAATLRTENASLKQDLAFDQTELLWLQMQFKALEVEVQVTDEGAEKMEGYAPGLRDEIRKVKRERVAREMNRWEKDWEDVERKMKGRRKRYDAFADENDAAETADPGVDGAFEGDAPSDWRLAIVKKGHGKVQQIVVTRVSAQTGAPFDDNDETTEEIQVQPQHEELSVAENLPVVETAPEEPEQHLQPVLGSYIAQGTQTEEVDAESESTSSWLFVEEYQVDHPATNGGDDCAITTSSEDNDEIRDLNDDSGTTLMTPVKTALQELWSGLTSLAGLGDDES